MSPSRVDVLVIREQVVDELRRADTKATTLLSLVGAALAGVIALSTRAMPSAAAVLLWSSMALIGASVAVLLAVIRPRLVRHPVPGSWLYAAQVGPETFRESFDASADGALSAAEVCVVARLARSKFRLIGHAVTLLGCGLAVLVTSLLVAAVGS
jgi:hypothetical protein